MAFGVLSDVGLSPLLGIFGLPNGVSNAWTDQTISGLFNMTLQQRVAAMVGGLEWLSPFGVTPTWAMSLFNSPTRSAQLLGNYQNELLAAQVVRSPEAFLAHQARAAMFLSKLNLQPEMDILTAAKLASQFIPRLIPVRLFGFAFSAAFTKVMNVSAMALPISLLYQMNPSYTQSLISGSGYFAGLRYQPFQSALYSGVVEWTFAQVGIQSLFRKSVLKASLGISAMQPGLSMLLDVGSTALMRSILGMPMFFNQDEEISFKQH